MRATRFFSIAILIAAAALCLSSAGAADQLKVNLLVGNDSIMMYAGAADGIKVGDRYTIMRGDRMIGTCEVTRVEGTYSIAKISEKYEDIREMDTLKNGTQSAAKPKVAGEEKSKPKETKEAPKKETAKKEEPKKETKKEEKKETAKKETPKKEEKKAATKKEEPADEEAAAPKKDDKKADAKAAPSKPKGPLTYTTFPSAFGPTGLFQTPTAEIAENRKGSIAFYRTTWSGSSSGSGSGTATQTYSFVLGSSVSRTDIAVAYGIDQKFELSFAQSRVKLNAGGWIVDYLQSVGMQANLNMRATTIGVKFNPRKRVLLQPTTSKKFQTAIGIERINYNQGVPDNTIFYGAVTMPTKKFKAHATLYDVTGSHVGGRHWGTMGGLELPLTNKLSIITDADIFQGMETYSFGLRYFINEAAMASFGYMNITNSPSTMLNLGYKF